MGARTSRLTAGYREHSTRRCPGCLAFAHRPYLFISLSYLPLQNQSLLVLPVLGIPRRYTPHVDVLTSWLGDRRRASIAIPTPSRRTFQLWPHVYRAFCSGSYHVLWLWLRYESAPTRLVEGPTPSAAAHVEPLEPFIPHSSSSSSSHSSCGPSAVFVTEYPTAALSICIFLPSRSQSGFQLAVDRARTVARQCSAQRGYTCAREVERPFAHELCLHHAASGLRLRT